MSKKTKKLLIPVNKIRKNTTIPKPSKPGDAGADARIEGFKKIIVEGNKRELLDVKSV